MLFYPCPEFVHLFEFVFEYLRDRNVNVVKILECYFDLVQFSESHLRHK